MMLKRAEYNLRFIALNDLEKVLQWRNSERIRSNMFTDHEITLDEHKAWFNGLKYRTNSIYLVFEVVNKPIGLVYFTDIDNINGKSNWGFYLGEENHPDGSGTAMGILGLEYAFTQLNIRKLCSEVFGFNDASIRFHGKFGFAKEGKLIQHVLKNGTYQDVILFSLFQEDWIINRQKLD